MFDLDDGLKPEGRTVEQSEHWSFCYSAAKTSERRGIREDLYILSQARSTTVHILDVCGVRYAPL